MSKQATKQVTKVEQTSLNQAREAMAEATIRGYGVTKAYAAALTVEFGEGWHSKDATDEQKKQRETERKAFMALCEAKKPGTNARMPWKRTLAAAAGKSEDEAQAKGVPNERKAFLPYVAERMTEIMKRGYRDREKGDLGVQEQRVLNALEEFFEKNPEAAKALGINTAKLAQEIADKTA